MSPRHRGERGDPEVFDSGHRCVATLVATGLVNSWILVGSFHALLVTEYGQVLILKLVVFAAMLAFAAVNRLSLTPQLAVASGKQREAVRRLTRNSVIEIVLGFSFSPSSECSARCIPPSTFRNNAESQSGSNKRTENATKKATRRPALLSMSGAIAAVAMLSFLSRRLSAPRRSGPATS